MRTWRPGSESNQAAKRNHEAISKEVAGRLTPNLTPIGFRHPMNGGLVACPVKPRLRQQQQAEGNLGARRMLRLDAPRPAPVSRRTRDASPSRAKFKASAGYGNCPRAGCDVSQAGTVESHTQGFDISDGIARAREEPGKSRFISATLRPRAAHDRWRLLDHPRPCRMMPCEISQAGVRGIGREATALACTPIRRKLKLDGAVFGNMCAREDPRNSLGNAALVLQAQNAPRSSAQQWRGQRFHLRAQVFEKKCS